MSRRPEIDRLLADLVASIPIDGDEVDTVHQALHEAFNAGASSVIGDYGHPPVHFVQRFIKERLIRFDDAMETSPKEHLREYERWRRMERAKTRSKA